MHVTIIIKRISNSVVSKLKPLYPCYINPLIPTKYEELTWKIKTITLRI